MERARVSDVLSYFEEPFLVKWKLKMAITDPVQLTEYGDALIDGTIVDLIVQKDLNGMDYKAHEFNPSTPIQVKMKTPTYKEVVTNCMKAWEKFKIEKPQVYERLKQFKHNMQRELVLGDLVGHPDFILDDEVIDLKTSKSVSKSHWMQTSQYALMHDSQRLDSWQFNQSNCRIQKISILRLDKLTGDYEYKTLEEPFITFWQRKFQARYEAFCEDKEFANMMQTKLEGEKL